MRSNQQLLVVAVKVFLVCGCAHHVDQCLDSAVTFVENVRPCWSVFLMLATQLVVSV